MGVVVYGTGHIKSTLGLLKISEIVLCLIAIILVAVHGWTSTLIKSFYAGTIIGIILSLLILILSITEAGHSLNGVLKFQCYVLCLLFIYLTIVSSILLARRYSKSHKAGGAFGLFAAICYLVDALISYKAYGNTIMCV